MRDTDVNHVFTLAADWRKRLPSEMERSAALAELLEKAILTDEGIRLGLKMPVWCGRPGGAPLRKVLPLFRFVPLKVKRRGVEMRLIINGSNEPRKLDLALLKAFARLRGWFEELASGRVRSLVEVARREGLAKRHISRLTKLAFVSPVFVEYIAKGQAPIATNLQMLGRPCRLPARTRRLSVRVLARAGFKSAPVICSTTPSDARDSSNAVTSETTNYVPTRSCAFVDRIPGLHSDTRVVYVCSR